MWLANCNLISKKPAKFVQSFIIHPRRSIVLEASSPMAPGLKWSKEAWRCLFQQPGGDRWMSVYPIREHPGISEVDLGIVDFKTGVSECFADGDLSFLNLLPRVRIR